MSDHPVRNIIRTAERLQYRQDHPTVYGPEAVRAAFDALCRAVADAGKACGLVVPASLPITDTTLFAIVRAANEQKHGRMLLEQSSDGALTAIKEAE